MSDNGEPSPDSILGRIDALLIQIQENTASNLKLFNKLNQPPPKDPGPLLVQMVAYKHHKFTTTPYTTKKGKTVISKLDERLKGSDVFPEKVLVAPTTDCKVDFNTKGNDNEIASITPNLVTDQVLESPLQPKEIVHQAVTSPGVLKIWMFW